MYRKIALLFISLLPLVGFAQSDTGAAAPEYKKYKWDSIPKLHDLAPDEEKRGMVIIQDKRIIEYYFETKDNIVVYTTRQRIVRVNSDKAIEENNTVYIPTGEDVSVLDVHARAITKEGKVTNLDPANIKDVGNYNNLGPFKIFAIDGIEKGGEVEYLYTVRQPFRLFGSESIRANALIKNMELDIYTPSNLVFETKSYNGFPQMKVDTTLTVKRRIYMSAHDITGYDNEQFSEENGALMRMEYKFTYNTVTDAEKKLYTYSEFCQKLYDLLDKSSDKKDLKTAEKVIDTMKISKLSDEDRIRRIESHIKNSISMREDAKGDQYRSLPDIFKNHVCDEIGLLKLYHLLFNEAKVTHEIVLTTDRFDKPFDGEFESWTYLQKYLIYFPTTGQFMAPTEIFSRYGFPPADWICQQGLFIHGVSLGSYNTGIGQTKDISCNDYKQSMNDIFADVKFDFDMGVVNMHYKETFTGYEAYPSQPLYSFLSDDDKKEFLENPFKGVFPDAKPTNVQVSGYKELDLYHQPFVIEGDFSTNSVMEKAGNKYLFKIGMLIGPQSELYRDTVRHTPIENHYNHGYHRELAFTIPDGYKVTNLEAVNMDVFDTAKGERTMEFHSYYKTDGDKVTVMIDEDYRQLRYPISMYDQFRRVINASADFNKVVLFIEKK
jgi:hypothetical protein